MKKTIFLAAMLLFVSNSFAQIVVDSLGRVGVGGTETLSTAKLFVKVDSTANSTTAAINCNSRSQYGIFLNKTNYFAADSPAGIYVTTSNPYGRNFGIQSRSMGAGGTNKYAVGMIGQAGLAETSVGVCGNLNSTVGVTNSAGIYGTTSAQSLFNFGTYPGTYAGFFYGDVRVAHGSIYGTVLSPSSNSGPGGTNVITFDDERGNCVTEKLSQVQTIQFMRNKWELENEEQTEDFSEEEVAALAEAGIDVNAIQGRIDTNESTLSAIQYGLAADQLIEVYPELVYEDKNGNISINYVEMVPLLVKAINELSSELAELKGTSSKKVKGKKETTTMEESVAEMDMVRMDQNKPNPFSESTVITLNIPKDTKTATILIYDLSGKQVKSIPVNERGKTDITVYASDLTSGMYIYNLVVDGQVKVTRRMMVSEV